MSLPFFIALLLLCCGYALIRGGAPERIAAGLQLGAFALGLALHLTIEASHYRSTLAPTAIVDLALLVALTALALRSARWWPLLLTSWQLASIVAHVAREIDPGMMRVGYAVQAQIWAYPMLLVTAAAAWRHRRRLAAVGADPAWKEQLL